MSLHAQVPPRSTDREYDALARHYDAFTAHPHYAEWVGSLEALARRHGLRGRRALDLGCGTGSARCHSWSSATTSSGAMRRPGWSPRRSTSWRARRGDLQRALAAAAARLAPGGVLLFDANTLATYATFFSRTHARETEALMMVWVGNGDESPRPGAMPCARLEVFERTSGRAWRRTTSRHRQRHHAADHVRAALAGAGLRLLAVHGSTADGEIEDDVDERRHVKAIYVATHDDGERR
jgi:hypothetical protein